MIVLVGGADRPGDYYVFRPAEGVMHFLAHVSSDLKARTLFTRQDRALQGA